MPMVRLSNGTRLAYDANLSNDELHNSIMEAEKDIARLDEIKANREEERKINELAEQPKRRGRPAADK